MVNFSDSANLIAQLPQEFEDFEPTLKELGAGRSRRKQKRAEEKQERAKKAERS